MKIWIKIGVFVAFMGFCWCSEETTLQPQMNLTDISETISPPINSTANSKIFKIIREKPKDSTLQLSSDELSTLKSAAIRDLVNHTIFQDISYRSNPKRIECMLENIKKSNYNDDFSSEVSEIHNTTVSIKFYDNEKNSQKLQSIIDDASSSCFLFGLIPMIILIILMIFIVAVVACLSKTQARWSRLNLA